MLIVITGGSGSGKSEYAENRAIPLSENRTYIATMMVYDEEGKQRVKRHQDMRALKNFHTLECPMNLDAIPKNQLAKDAVVLLECMSNLVANEMFSSNSSTDSPEKITQKILKGVSYIRNQVKDLIIVTNEVFSDGIAYDSETTTYIQVLGAVNVKLASMADEIWEVICGIPVLYPFEKNKKEEVAK